MELKSSVGIRAANRLLRRALGTGMCIMRKSGYSVWRTVPVHSSNGINCVACDFPLFVISVAESGSERGDLDNLVKHAVAKCYYIGKFSCQLPPLQVTASCLQATSLFIPMCYIWTSYAYSVCICLCTYKCVFIYVYTHINLEPIY